MLQWAHGVVPGDARLNLWAMTWQWRTIMTSPANLWNGNAFYPFPGSITGSDHLFTEVLIGLPVYLITNNPFLTYHFVLFAGYAIGAWGMYFLCLSLFHRVTPAVAAAIFYTVALPRSVHAAAHIQIASMAWIPWSAFFLHTIFKRPGGWATCCLIVTHVLQILTGWYVAVYHGLIMTILTLTLTIRYRRREPVALAVLAAVIALVMIIPFALPYIGRPSVPPDVWPHYSAHPTDYLTPASYTVYSWNNHSLRMWSETTVWMGFIAPALVLITLFFRGKPDRLGRRPEVPGYILSLIAGIALSFGTHFPGLPDAWTPWNLLARLPAVSGMRVPARFVMMVVFALSVLFGRAVWVIAHKLTWRRLGESIAVLAVILTMVENYPTVQVEPVRVRIPPVYDWLTTIPDSVAIAEAPSFYGSDLWAFSADYMMYAALHRHPIANGYSRYVPDGFPEISDAIKHLPHPAAIRRLKNAGIVFVILHPRMFFTDEMLGLFRTLSTSHNPMLVFNDVITASNTLYQSFHSPEGLMMELRFMQSPYLDFVDRFGEDLVFYLKDTQLVDAQGAQPNDSESM
ncbi:hypothetical protein JXA80_09845 [bacterium]|nr:hypothetical protein [candidate division CSSED10-310 bacterium]